MNIKASPPPQILVVGMVRRAHGTDPVCVVRWALGDSGNELPWPTDIFDVELVVDGRVVASSVVSPHNYAMLDPIRVPVPYPDTAAPGRTWLVASKPTAAIDPRAAEDESLKDDAVGVMHILKPTTTPSMRYRAASFLHKVFYRTIKDNPVLSGLTNFQLIESAVAFADRLVRSDIRPIHLPQLAPTAFTALQSGNIRESFLALDGANKVRNMTHSALVLQTLTIPGVATTLEEIVEESRQVRNHIRCSALQGGEMIDYWCDPKGVGRGLNESERGKRYPASELIGLGCRIPLVTAQVESWVEDKKSLVVIVRHRPRSIMLLDLNELDAKGFADPAGEIHLQGDVTMFAENQREIDWSRLKRAMLFGSSHPPSPPSNTWVDWSMVRVEIAQTNPADPAIEPSTAFRTGDGKVEIHIGTPEKPMGINSENNETVAAYNVYGVWQGAPGFDKYFNDPTLNPTLMDLQPWLMTRRYSYTRDLRAAFPPIEGAQHPALTDALQTPHWHPLLKRPDVLENTNDPVATPLPDISGNSEAVFTVDLRTGMGMLPPDRPPIGWDLAGPLAAAWRPELDRDLKPISGGQPIAQRYRFWVTSVDPFEQESEPVPVRTEDHDLNESPNYLFAPVRRAPLSGPEGGEFLRCEFEEANLKVRVSFETPYEGQISGKEFSAVAKRIDKDSIQADVALFRRPISSMVGIGNFVSMMTGLPALPQWQKTASKLAVDGWRMFKFKSCNSAKSGDTWEALFELGPDDKGWEYLAAIGFTVRDSHAGFWGKSVIAGQKNSTGRKLVRFHPIFNSDSPPRVIRYDPTPTWIDETPMASSITLSKHCIVSDPKEPWWPSVGAVKIWVAKPITAPPGIRRDMVLQKLLDRNFTRNGARVNRESWGGVELTIGQIAMCRTAINRTIENNPELILKEDSDFEIARKLLAQDFRDKEQIGLRQHATIGFRGLVEIQWDYKVRSLRPKSDAGKYSEAVTFRVYTTTIPDDQNARRNFATLIANIELSTDRKYSLTLSKGTQDEWKTISELKRPTAVLITWDDKTVLTHVLTTIEDAGALIVEFDRPSNGALPKVAATAFFFAAQPLIDYGSINLDQTTSNSLLLPIPGGGPSTIAWWVTSISAAGRESPRQGISPMQARFMGRTTEPPEIGQFTVVPATNQDIHYLDPKKYPNWRPESVKTIQDAKFYPRILLTWIPPESSDKIMLEVQRVARQIAKSPVHFEALTRTSWDAVKSVESAPENADLASEDLDLMTEEWLLGKPIDVPGSSNPFVLFGPPKNSIPINGALSLQGSPEAGFIDYFGTNSEGVTDGIVAMDGNWEYSYRLRTFINLGDNLPEPQRFLYSSATLWSSYVGPETPKIRLSPKQPQIFSKSLLKPRIRFIFDPSVALFLFNKGISFPLAEHHWEYRIVIRRLLDTPFFGVSTTKTEVWVDVGKPLIIPIFASLQETYEIVDEDVDRNWQSHEPVVVYKVFIQQFLIVENTDGKTERLIRAYESDPKTTDIPPITLLASNSRDTEVEVVQEIHIK